MMEKLTKKQYVNRLTFLFAITYMISYITRINYGAIILEMESATSFSKSLLSMALTGHFITYGIGQIFSGIIGDKISPKKLVTIGLATTTVMNLMIPICSGPFWMLGVWCINGFAQSLMWPPIVRLMTTLLSAEDYKWAATRVSWGSSFGTIAVYLISPILISAAGWKSVFIFSAFCGCVMIFFWNRYSYNISPQPIAPEKEKSAPLLSFFSPLMLGIMVAIVLQGMLRDGVTTWMPTYISETYNLSNVISILTGIVLPIFSIICHLTSSKLYSSWLRNPLTCGGFFFGLGAISALGLYLLNGSGAALSVALSAVLTGCMHGVNLILICMIPPFFSKTGKVSTVSGLLNSCTYIGSAISTWGMALASETYGWNFTLLLWLIIAISGTAICLLLSKPWQRKYQ